MRKARKGLKSSWTVLLIVSVFFTSSVWAQHGVVVGADGAPPGGTAGPLVDILADASDGLTAFQWDLYIEDASEFDSVTPQYRNAFDGGNFTNCLSPPAGGFISPTRDVVCGHVSPQAGDGPNSMRIRWTVNSTDLGNIVDLQVGRLLIEIAAGATAPQSIPIEVANNVTGGGTSTLDENGEVQILDVSATLDVQPTSINFGTEFTSSTSAPQLVTISNIGSDGVDLEITNITVSGDFVLDGPPCIGATISDGNDCLQGVVFSPTSDGPHTGTLTVFSDAGEVLNDTVNLSGNAISPPTDLVFAVSPHYGVEGGPLFWGVEVQVLDANGALYTADNTTIVEITLETDPTGAATLSGNTEMMVDNGVATFAFTDLSIDLVGNGFRLQASDQAGSLDSALSGFFNVVEDQLLRDRFEQ